MPPGSGARPRRRRRSRHGSSPRRSRLLLSLITLAFIPLGLVLPAGLPPPLGSFDREADDEARAETLGLAGLIRGAEAVLGPDGATMRLDDLAGDGKPQS